MYHCNNFEFGKHQTKTNFFHPKNMEKLEVFVFTKNLFWDFELRLLNSKIDSICWLKPGLFGFPQFEVGLGWHLAIALFLGGNGQDKQFNHK